MEMSKHYKRWSADEDEYMQNHYADLSNDEVGKNLGRTRAAVLQRANHLGLKKSQEFMSSGSSGRIMPGETPWNKGKKYEVTPCGTHYKPGHLPHSTLPIGTVRLYKGHPYIKVKETPIRRERWRPVPEIAWIEANGPLPDDHIVVFKPGMHTDDIQKITAERLQAVTRAELMERNTIHRYPAELRGAMIQLGYMRNRLNEEHQ